MKSIKANLTSASGVRDLPPAPAKSEVTRSSTWRLKRTAQCKKCPWLVGTDPREIPNGYCENKHKSLASTIAAPGDIGDAVGVLSGREPLRVFACHETGDAHCVGWLANQLGRGNNIALRISMTDCENARNLRLRGEQHETFEQTLPQ